MCASNHTELLVCWMLKMSTLTKKNTHTGHLLAWVVWGTLCCICWAVLQSSDITKFLCYCDLISSMLCCYYSTRGNCALWWRHKTLWSYIEIFVHFYKWKAHKHAFQLIKIPNTGYRLWVLHFSFSGRSSTHTHVGFTCFMKIFHKHDFYTVQTVFSIPKPVCVYTHWVIPHQMWNITFIK